MSNLVSLRTARQSFLHPVCFALLAIAFLFPAATAQAQIIDWTNTTNSNAYYHVGGNWGGGTAPTATQTARFNQAGTYEVWWDSTTAGLSPAVGFLNVLQGNVTFDNRDGSASTQYLFTINGSGGAGAFSDFSISGGSTSLTNRGLHLQSLGGGEILGGATLTLDGSDPNGAKLTVGGSTGFDVSGNLNVQSGGIFENTSGYIGRLSGSMGVATVTGSGSQWNNSGGLLSVGHGGEGVLNVQNGGVVSSLDGYIGLLAGSTGEATISNIGSHWNNSRFFYVGLSGNGTLKVEAGGLVSNTDGYIGALFGSAGEATVTGSGSQWNNSSGLYIGGTDTVAGGNGSLTISDSGLVNVTGTTKLWNSGTLNLNGGDLTTGSFDNSALGAFNFNDGTLTVDGGVFNPGVSNFVINGNTSSALPKLRMTNGASSTLTGGLRVGDSRMGSLSIEAGGLVSNSIGVIGASSGSTGEATVTGSGSQWNNSGFLDVGSSGFGTLNVEAGGLVSNSFGFIGVSSGSTGEATVTGSGSQWNNSNEFSVGVSGSGTLNVEAGGLVTNTSGYIGRNSGSTGTVKVTGSGSQWNNSNDLFLGGSDSADGGMGTLNIQDSGQVNVGNDLYTGSNTALTISDSGSSGNLWVRNGSLINNAGSGFIGFGSGSTGTATVTGIGSQWNNSSGLYIGGTGTVAGGNGSLTISDSGLVNVTGTTKLWNSGTLILNGGDLTTGSFDNSALGAFNFNDGTLTVDGGVFNPGVSNFVIDGNTSSALPKLRMTNGASSTLTGGLRVGDSRMGSLSIEAGGLVSNSIGVIGASSGSTGEATVTGSGSQWNNSNSLFLGGSSTTDGGMGTLNIQDSGQVNVGNDLYTGSNTALTISDSGSSGNLWVRNGSLINNAGSGFIGFGSGSTGTATVTGIGSQWNNSASLYIGGTDTVAGGNGSLTISDSGLVSVTSTTKLWNSGTLILNGGDLTTGSFDNSALGAFNFNDGTLTVDGGVFNPGVSNFVIDGNTSSALPKLRMTNGASWTLTGELRVGDSQMGSLSIEAGGLVSNTDGYIGALSGSTGTATVSGSGSQWNNSGNLFVGDSGTGTLNIEAGGLVSSNNGYIGVFGGTGTATVTGSGSQWNITSSALAVGNSGTGTLNVEAGGLVSNSFGFIGINSGSTGTVTVTGSGSQWNNTNWLRVGESGTGTLNVEAGGLVSNSFGYLGLNSGSTGTVKVTGSGSQWNNSNGLFLGGTDSADGGMGTLNIQGFSGEKVNVGNDLYTGSLTALTISDSGSGGNLWVRNGSLINNAGSGFIGFGSGSTGTATVTGIGSQWNNSSGLYVGDSGTGTLNVAAGGQVSSSSSGYIGHRSGSTGEATVTGSGSLWNTPGLLVGHSGNGTLIVEAGGLVNSRGDKIGHLSGSTGWATVTGNGSQWNNTADLFVGDGGNGTLNIEAGGLVSNTFGYIGSNSESTGEATVTGSGSQWNNSNWLRVGNSGNGTLNVATGGLVSNTFGYIGSNSGSTGEATVTGSGSQWNNSSDLYVGNSGSGTLNVEAGGLVSNSTGLIGFGSGSTGEATVTGSGSQWNNSNGLFLGGTDSADGGMGTLNIQDSGQVNVGNDLYTGSNTALTISDSGSSGNLWVRNGSLINNAGSGFIGFNAGSTGVATVTGSGSQWNNSSDLFLGGTNSTDGGVGTLRVTNSGQVNIGNDLIGPGFAALVISDTGSNGNLWVRNNSTITTDDDVIIAGSLGTNGTATVTGSGSQWNNEGYLSVGDYGSGTLNIEGGGLVSSAFGSIGTHVAEAAGTATVTGSGSQWDNTSELYVGTSGSGTLNVEAGGLVSNTVGYIGFGSGSTGTVTVTGSGSQWDNSGELYVGNSGSGTLNVEAGGLVSNSFNSTIGADSGSMGTATVTGSGSQWNNSSSLFVGFEGNGTLNVEAGGLVSDGFGFIGINSGSTGTVTVTGSGSQWNNSNNLYVGSSGNGTLNVEAGGMVSNDIGYIGDDANSMGTATVTGSGSQWDNTSELYVGTSGSGTLNVGAGGLVSNTVGYIGGFGSGSAGTATVTGSGSQWNNSSDLYVSNFGTGTLNVEAGGLVSNNSGYIGRNSGSTGTATVTGSDSQGNASQWNNSGSLSVGNSGTGTLNVEAGGLVSNTGGYIGYNSGSTGTATVTGSGSQWNNSGNLYIGGTDTVAGGNGSLTISDSGLVNVTGTTKLWNSGTLNLDGGTLATGTFDPFDGTFNWNSGTLRITGSAGLDQNDLFDPVLVLGSNQTLDVTNEIRMTGSNVLVLNGGNLLAGSLQIDGGSILGTTDLDSITVNDISGHGNLNVAMNSTASSTITAEGTMTIGRAGSTTGFDYAGTLNVGSHQVTLHDRDGAQLGANTTIGDGGHLVAVNGSVLGAGEALQSTGNALVDGDFENSGLVMGSDLGDYLSFNDNVYGSGSFTGNVRFLQEYNPGNSPGIVELENVDFGISSTLNIELGGLMSGLFDQLFVSGDMNVDGSLDVALIDGFTLDFGQEFLIADITGSRTGFFNGLGEGDLVGNYGGMNLFISYGAGNGNDISLFTSVPEPGTAGLLGLAMLGLAMSRRRRNRM